MEGACMLCHILRRVIIFEEVLLRKCWEPHCGSLAQVVKRCNWNMFSSSSLLAYFIFVVNCKHSAIKWSNWAYSLFFSLNLSSCFAARAVNTCLDQATTCLDNSYHYTGSFYEKLPVTSLESNLVGSSTANMQWIYRITNFPLSRTLASGKNSQ